MKSNRRDFLTMAGLGTLGVATLTSCSKVNTKGDLRPVGRGRIPKKIIMLIADGMSLGTLTCADYYSRLKRGKPLFWRRMLEDPDVTCSLMNMRSLNSIVTDSAAASSSWGSGSRVNNGTLNTLPDGTELIPLLPVLKDAGWRVGIATTTTASHATPAGFLVAEGGRGNQTRIAEKYVYALPNVFLGGGGDYFWQVEAEFSAAGYEWVRNLQELEQAPQTELLGGIFYPGHLPYIIDRTDNSIPTLAQMTTAALRQLSQSDRFFLQVEGGRVDHAAHASDAATIVNEMLDFDAAVETAFEYQQRHPETLLIVTTDHGNSNMGVTGMGLGYMESSQAFEKLLAFKASHARILTEIGAQPLEADNPMKGFYFKSKPTAQNLIQVAQKYTGLTIDKNAAAEFIESLVGKFGAGGVNPQLSSPLNLLGQIFAPFTGIGWTGNTHTSDFVILNAYGPGQERFGGFLQNTDLFPVFMDFAKLNFKNPSKPLADPLTSV
ncbi:MAG: alkaline phosphatase [Verrucomicrobiae bacterium]|nr:alkaline phosphatase [Verrucomicrobiae bacterium]